MVKATLNEATFCDELTQIGKKTGARYLIVHKHVEARPDMYDKPAKIAMERCTILYQDTFIGIVALW